MRPPSPRVAAAVCFTTLGFTTLLAAAQEALGMTDRNNPTVSWTEVATDGGPTPPGRIPAASASCGETLIIFGSETDGDSTSIVPNRYLNDVWQFLPHGPHLHHGKDSTQGDRAASGVWKKLS